MKKKFTVILIVILIVLLLAALVSGTSKVAMQNAGIFGIALGLSFLAGISTVIGGGLFYFVKKCEDFRLSFLLGLSAGTIIYMSFMDLLPYSVSVIGFGLTNILFFTGILTMVLIDFVLPHNYIEEKFEGKTSGNPLMRTGMLTAFGLMIHNFPEGMAVAISTAANLKLGVVIALAVFIHNIPEGIAIAAPIYHATKDRFKALKYTFFAAIAEPVGAILAIGLLLPFMTEAVLSYVFAFVSGIMIFISFDELLPACFRHAESKQHGALSGIVIGMIIMSVSVVFINQLL